MYQLATIGARWKKYKDMLYVYYGTDEKTSRNKLRRAMDALQRRAPYAHILRVTDQDEEAVSMKAILSSQGLFHARQVVLLDGTFSNKGIREDIFKHIREIKESDHVFFLYEKKLLAAHEKKLAQHADNIEKSEHREAIGKKENPFALANAFGRGKRSEVWIEYRKALAKGAAPEALHGMLFWKVKDMLLKGKCGDKEDEYKEMLGVLAEMPHKTRRDGIELEYALERFILSLR